MPHGSPALWRAIRSRMALNGAPFVAAREPRSLRRLLQDLVGRRGDDLDIFRNELAALDKLDEFRLELVGENLSDARMLLDVRPFGDQEETLRVLGVATQHAVLHLRP